LPKSFIGDGTEDRFRAFKVRSLAIPIRVRGEEGREAKEKRALRRSGAEEEVDDEVQRWSISSRMRRLNAQRESEIAEKN
jgi:hypothetical protein